MQYQFQNILLLFVFLFFGYVLYRQNKKFRAEEKQYRDSAKLIDISTLYDQQEEEETKQIA
jgi:hypothetical protein